MWQNYLSFAVIGLKWTSWCLSNLYFPNSVQFFEEDLIEKFSKCCHIG